MRATYHCHCDYCDGKAPARSMARTAVEAGFDVLGFSSHAPLGRGIYDGNMKLERLGEYVAEIRAIGREYRSEGLEVLVGLEVDWLKGIQAPADGLFARAGLDYTIGSVHLVDLGFGPFAVDDEAARFDERVRADAGGDARRVWKAYYRELCGLVEAGGFDILGHHDLIMKNNQGGRWFDDGDPEYRAAALEPVRLLAGKGIAAEINYGCISRGKSKVPYPALFILREMRELGVPIVLSADAHAPEQLAANRSDAIELARAAGYRSVVALSEGRWREVSLDEA